MVPGWQPRGVKRKARLAREWPTKGLPTCEHRSALSAEADCFSEFLKLSCLQFLAVQESFDVSGHQARFLKRQLRGAREGWCSIFEVSDVAESENVFVGVQLQSGSYQDQ